MIYLLTLSGYFTVTGQGQALTVFDRFDIPALVLSDAVMEWSGDIHQYGAYLLMALATLHLLAALKHHYIDKDAVLKRMLGK